MAVYKIALLPGDGIGPEVTEEGVKVLRAVQESSANEVGFEFEPLEASAKVWLRTRVALSDEAFACCREADAMLMGAIGLPEARHPDGREMNGDVIFRLRFDLDLYAGVRPARLLPGLPGPLRDTAKGIDYVIIRENVEGLYASRNGGCLLRDETATDTIIISRLGTARVSDYAFRLARSRKGRPSDGRSIVTCVDKANVLRSYAFFRKVFTETAERHPDIGRECIYIDAMTAFQVLDPSRFDVVVAENMFGDILSDLSAATVGGLGLAPSGDIGENHGLFQPSHGSAPDIAGRNRANPIAAILSAGMMLDWLGERHGHAATAEAGEKIRLAVDRVLEAGAVRTPDIGGRSGTREFGDEVVRALRGLYR